MCLLMSHPELFLQCRVIKDELCLPFKHVHSGRSAFRFCLRLTNHKNSHNWYQINYDYSRTSLFLRPYKTQTCKSTSERKYSIERRTWTRLRVRWKERAGRTYLLKATVLPAPHWFHPDCQTAEWWVDTGSCSTQLSYVLPGISAPKLSLQTSPPAEASQTLWEKDRNWENISISKRQKETVYQYRPLCYIHITHSFHNVASDRQIMQPSHERSKIIKKK